VGRILRADLFQYPQQRKISIFFRFCSHDEDKKIGGKPPDGTIKTSGFC
jgi:hypothetical protein